MQATSAAVSTHPAGFNSSAASQCTEMADKFWEEFSAKLKVAQEKDEKERELRLREVEEEAVDDDEGEEEEEEEEEDDFSFVCTNPDGSPISADDIFQNGQIRPVFPFFNRDLLLAENVETGDAKMKDSTGLRPPLKKLFVDQPQQESISSSESEEPEGPFCVWKGKAAEASPEVCKKSNSTGFSKLWRFRELVLRSNSDGKDAFVFFNHHNHNPSTAGKTKTSIEKIPEKSQKVSERKKAVKKAKTGEKASSAHERHYVMNRAMKEGVKRKSYLPYQHVGFFTNMNGLTKNVHPF